MTRTLSLICTAACFSLVIVTLVFGILYVVQGSDEIEYPHHLWWWCVIYSGLIALSLVNAMVKMMIPLVVVSEVEAAAPAPESGSRVRTFVTSYVYNYRNPMDSILRLSELGMFIWGVVIMAGVGLSGHPYNHHLYTWFAVMFWFLVAWMAVMYCLFLCVLWTFMFV